LDVACKLHFDAYMATDVTATLYCECHVSCMVLLRWIYDYTISFVSGLTVLVNKWHTVAWCCCHVRYQLLSYTAALLMVTFNYLLVFHAASVFCLNLSTGMVQKPAW